MHPTNYFSFWYLFLRSLLPTVASFIVCSIIAFAMIGVHLLLISMNAGMVLPRIFNSLTGTYTPQNTSQFVRPIGSVVHSPHFSMVVLVAVFMLGGWATFKLVEMFVTAVRNLHENQKSVYVPAEMVVVYHPLRRALAARLAWRFCILVIAISFVMLAQPLVQHIWTWDERVSQADTLLGLARYLVVVYAAWMTLLHVLLVLLRLFLLRTRVFGEMVH
ncbi:MAG TPA: hypothetical protein VLG16_00840 [Candidatus Saccharimonadales bacterium]|nr:hypothetical protein [Candidatus Saccharimonadales bacterium]